ncbi:hypothetical protein ABZ801_34970 [Actinomadura sp. NPDC047616]|uniref:hypothetical protein n=1 Tax=Actinomadura sp. NPDC047616 TaxID=3155914 RepID=UPI0033E05EF6
MRTAGVIAIAGLLFGSAACSGGGDEAATAASPGVAGGSSNSVSPPAGSPAESKVRGELESCLKKAGIQGIPTATEKLSEARQRAVQKCGLAVIGQANPAVQKTLDELRACVKRHGVAVPPAGQVFVPDVKDPAMGAAVRSCTK